MRGTIKSLKFDKGFRIYHLRQCNAQWSARVFLSQIVAEKCAIR